METVEIDGLGIAYERAGHGPPLVLLHGCNIDAPEAFNQAVRSFLRSSGGRRPGR
jgi:pimeloyl-ACP methyl ester carboxylesterase